MKLGRNEICLCGSGLKYKNCHLNRHEDDPLRIQDIYKEQKKAQFKECFHPEASTDVCTKIIKAHSIQKNGILSKIARDNHIYNFAVNFGTKKSSSFLTPKLVGLNNASTFTGFCSFHDTETFKPIELLPIEVSSHHIFLLAYRAICKELYAKKFQSNMIPFAKKADRGKSKNLQKSIQEHLNIYEKGVTAGLNDIKNTKESYDKLLLSKNYDLVRYLVFELDNIPEFFCSGRVDVQYDFEGNILQGVSEYLDYSKNLDAVAFSIVTSNSKGLIIFSCMENELKSIAFLKSLRDLSKHNIPNAIARFTFEYFENTFFSPNWWDNLDESIKDAILKRINIIPLIYDSREQDVLLNDGINYVNWKINNTFMNI